MLMFLAAFVQVLLPRTWSTNTTAPRAAQGRVRGPLKCWHNTMPHTGEGEAPERRRGIRRRAWTPLPTNTSDCDLDTPAQPSGRWVGTDQGAKGCCGGRTCYRGECDGERVANRRVLQEEGLVGNTVLDEAEGEVLLAPFPRTPFLQNTQCAMHNSASGTQYIFSILDP